MSIANSTNFFALLIENREQGWQTILQQKKVNKTFLFLKYFLPPFLIALFSFLLFSFKPRRVWLWEFVYSPLKLSLFFIFSFVWIFVQQKMATISAQAQAKKLPSEQAFLLSFFSFYPLVFLLPFYALPSVGILFALFAFLFSMRLFWQGASLLFIDEQDFLWRWYSVTFSMLLFFFCALALPALRIYFYFF